MATFDPKLYDTVMSQPEGMRHTHYRKALARCVSVLTTKERQDILGRREEIEYAEEEWKELNHEVLLRLGFSEGEAGQLRDKRLDSPGMRFLIKRRADEIKKRLRAASAMSRVR